MADGEDWDEDEPVGYKRPPRWGRFPKGQSGNPRGRPPKMDKKVAIRQPAKLTEFEQLIRDLLGEEVLLTLGGRKMSVTKKRALLLNLFKQAMNGTPVAIREMNRVIEKVEAKQEALERAEAEAAQQVAKEKAEKEEAEFRFLVDLRERQAKVWEQVSAEGRQEPDEPWPHPDDILINATDRTAWVRGPFSSTSVSDWEYLRRLRDHHLARYALALFDEREGKGLVALIWWVALFQEDRHLPIRWQVMHKLEVALARYMLMPLRELRKLVAIGAEEFEKPRPGLRLSRDAYRQQNILFGPMLKVLGYRSLKHFERAYEGD